VAAIVGGGFKGLSIQVPVVDSLKRQLLLAFFGLALIGTYGWQRRTAPARVDAPAAVAAALTEYDSGHYLDALSAFNAAAEAGSPEAQYHLGEMLFHGEGTVPDTLSALRWIRESAGAGYAPAQGLEGFFWNKTARGLGH